MDWRERGGKGRRKTNENMCIPEKDPSWTVGGEGEEGYGMSGSEGVGVGDMAVDPREGGATLLWCFEKRS